MDKQKLEKIKTACILCNECKVASCKKCPYRDINSDCVKDLLNDVLSLIQELESDGKDRTCN